MIDVFLRWYPQTLIRERMAALVRDAIMWRGGVRLHVVDATMCGAPYHIESKRWAEREAKSEIYCVMDDDQLPLRADFFSYGAAVLASHPSYGMLAGFPLEYDRAGQPYAGMENAMIVEAHSIGCPYFVRKGTITHFPDSPLRSYDGDLSKVITDQGLKTGLMPAALYNHLGYGFSQVEKT